MKTTEEVFAATLRGDTSGLASPETRERIIAEGPSSRFERWYVQMVRHAMAFPYGCHENGG